MEHINTTLCKGPSGREITEEYISLKTYTLVICANFFSVSIPAIQNAFIHHHLVSTFGKQMSTHEDSQI